LAYPKRRPRKTLPPKKKEKVSTEMATKADSLDPRHWRERAEKTRDRAKQFSMRNSRDRLLKIAEDDRLAERVAERQQAIRS
jgi:hypothetical protein